MRQSWRWWVPLLWFTKLIDGLEVRGWSTAPHLSETDEWKWGTDQWATSLKLMNWSERLINGPPPWNWWVEVKGWLMGHLPETDGWKWEADLWATCLELIDGSERLINGPPPLNWWIGWEADLWSTSLKLMGGSERLIYGQHPWNWSVEVRGW